MRSPSGWAKFLRACGAGASRGDLYLLRLALSFIFPYWHYHSSFPIGIIIHLSRLALSFIFPDWHYHSSFPIGIIIHLSRLALSFIFPDWHYHFIFLNRHHYCSGKLDWRGAKSSDYTVIGER